MCLQSDIGKSYSLLMKQNTTLFVSTLPLCVHFHQPNGPLSFPLQRKEFVVAPFLIKNFHKIHSECKPRIIGFISELRSLDQCFLQIIEHYHYVNSCFKRIANWQSILWLIPNVLCSRYLLLAYFSLLIKKG